MQQGLSLNDGVVNVYIAKGQSTLDHALEVLVDVKA
jgi:hypothetical protein